MSDSDTNGTARKTPWVHIHDSRGHDVVGKLVDDTFRADGKRWVRLSPFYMYQIVPAEGGIQRVGMLPHFLEGSDSFECSVTEIGFLRDDQLDVEQIKENVEQQRKHIRGLVSRIALPNERTGPRGLA